MTSKIESVRTATHLRTISRELAHRCAVAEVFVTSLDTVAADEFVAGAQLPRMHAYYGDHAGSLALRHDPLLVMEAARQAAIALAHKGYGVPPDMAFIVHAFNGTGIDGAAWEIGTAPADLVLHARVPRLHRRGRALHGLDMELDIECAGLPMMSVDGSFSWTTPQRWSQLRATHRESLGFDAFHGPGVFSERAAAALVGRENWRNVVIGQPSFEPGVARAVLVADPAHPFLFDHQIDHAPGSLIIEACRQTALSLVIRDSLRLAGVASIFDRFVELDSPAECRAEITERAVGRTGMHCEVHQMGSVAARVDLEFAEDVAAVVEGV